VTDDVFRGWHWLGHDRKLRYDDGREVVDGEPLSCAEPPVLCQSGMHASDTIRDAFGYADAISWSPDGYAWLCRVILSGEIVHGTDKSVARTRTVLESKRVHVSTVVEYAKWCAARAADAADAARAADAADAARRTAGAGGLVAEEVARDSR
jgi:hypothetical protein